jgi:2-isopropylmalate synthase
MRTDSNEAAPQAIKIFDTTLRDGEQSPGCSMTAAQKLRLATALAELGVDIIEAGFPQASLGDFDSVRRIAIAVGQAEFDVAGRMHTPSICGLARAQPGDIARCWEAIQDAKQPRIHTFIATSDIHLEHKLKMSKSQVLKQAVEAVRFAKSLCADVEFSAEDACRSDPEFLIEVFSAVAQAGARTLNVPDTVGYITPEEYSALIRLLVQRVDLQGAVLSTHCHDDLGLAVANSLAAVRAGARQVECTINGVGERAGNASLEEIVMALRTRGNFFGLSTGIDTRRLQPTSRLLTTLTGMAVARNKAIVGDNAFAHEAGIHQHGMLQNRATYEIMKPEDVGVSMSSLVLGKHSGRHALKDRISALGFKLSDVELDEVFVRFKALADKKKEVFDADVEALVMGDDGHSPGPWLLRRLHVSSSVGETALPTASVQLENVSTSAVVAEAAIGDGSVHAVFCAIERAVALDVTLSDYQIRSLSSGEDAQGQATVEALHAGQTFRGHAISTDVIEASALAFLEVINRIERKRLFRQLQQTPSAELVNKTNQETA